MITLPQIGLGHDEIGYPNQASDRCRMDNWETSTEATSQKLEHIHNLSHKILVSLHAHLTLSFVSIWNYL
jgi:hypothetical protein